MGRDIKYMNPKHSIKEYLNGQIIPCRTRSVQLSPRKRTTRTPAHPQCCSQHLRKVDQVKATNRNLDINMTIRDEALLMLHHKNQAPTITSHDTRISCEVRSTTVPDNLAHKYEQLRIYCHTSTSVYGDRSTCLMKVTMHCFSRVESVYSCKNHAT